MIVATAGHVDHGKTSLVKALTGIDTDTLAEEKRRGLSIDLGFAHADFGAGAAIGFVDVPGHERFVRNMVAGVACIDFALLVVAADDGPMPQTVEHVAILEWLGVPRCAVALTKVDRVPAERVAEVGLLIEALLAAGPFRGAPIFSVVATTGAGLGALREHLKGAAAAHAGREAGGHFRLAVDRSFSLAGAGQVVTGAVVAGRACVGDAVVVSPQGLALRLRGIQVHGEAVERVQAGQRCALNLAGAALKRASIGRGDWIVAPAAHAPTDRLDVRLGVSRTLDHALRHDSVVQLHLAATTVMARLATLEGRAIEPGGEAHAQLVLAQPIGALHGDRFIVRDPDANRTLGGGRVVDPFGWPRGRARPVRLAELGALAQPSAEAAFAALLESAAGGVDLQRFLQARNITRLEAEPLLRTLHATVVDVRKGVVVGTLDADGHGDLRAMAPAHWQTLRQRIVSALDTAHAAEPDRIGPTEAVLGTILGQRGADGVLRAALGSLVESHDVVRDGFCLRRPAHVAAMAAAESAMLDRVRAVLKAAGLRPPNVDDLAAALGAERSALLAHLVDLGRRGHLVQIAKNRFFLPETVFDLVRIARELADKFEDRTFDAAAYRDRSGLSRNLTIEVLEFLDRAGATRFHAGRRRIVDGAPMLR